MHIILYVLDALRADHLGCYGYKRDITPHIDQIAAEGVLFENCFTSTTWTRPVAASLLTGAYPKVHQTTSRDNMFSVGLKRLPEMLQTGGFETAAFNTMGNIAGEIGFSRGFDQYFDLFREPALVAKRHRLNAAKEGLLHTAEAEIALPLAEDINDYLLPWLAERKAENTFSFVWSIETHEPYGAPEPFRRYAGPVHRPGEGESDDIRSATQADRDRLMNLYDDGILYNDHCIGQLVDQLKQLGIYEDTLFLIVGDHGEAFYEHGFYTHGHPPYDELIHVPLIVKFPGWTHAGRRVAGLAELIDVVPTVTAVAHLPQPAETSRFIQGKNLLPLLTKEQDQVRTYTFSDTQSLAIHNRYLSVRSQEWKYIQIRQPQRNRQTLLKTVQHVLARGLLWDIIRRPRHFLRSYFRNNNEFLFNLQTDPAEQHNALTEHPEVAQELQQILEQWLMQNEQLSQQLGDEPLTYHESEALQKHLEKLGYL
ncbi:MAG: sulfatase [Ardenticatenaceae bacterium]|nr:sulfatase [Ardenticatenaceae bacterium]